MKKKLSGLAVVSVVLVVLLAAMPRSANAQFVVAGWSFPDAYGQGIEGFEFYENSSGSWEMVGNYYGYDDAEVVEWDAGVGIKLVCYTWFNSTLTGAGSSNEGKLLQRHNVTVTTRQGYHVFSQQNFTFQSVDTGIDPPLWFYGYYVILNFIPQQYEGYRIVVYYDVWY